MIKTILVALFLLLYLVLTIPILLVEWLIGLKWPEAKGKSCLAMVKWAFRVCIFLTGSKVVVIGAENVPTDTAVLYVGNHRSYFDVLTTYIQVPRLTGYIAKKEMLRYPLLRDWMKNLHCLFLDREDIKAGMKTILTAVEKVKSGISMTIFPEGTRNKDDSSFLPFHEGSFKIAEKGNVPVVPMTIVNTAAIFEEHLPYMKKATVIIEYGKPIYIKDLDKEDRKRVGAYVSNIMFETYQKNKKMLEENRTH